MTRKAKTLISMLTVIAVSVGLASSAMAYYSTGSGDQPGTPQSAPASPSAVVGNEGGQPSGNVATDQPADTVNATIVGNEGGQPSGNLATDSRLFSSAPSDLSAVSSSDGFDWGAALIGAGATLGLAMAAVLAFSMARRRTHLEPSV
jgi:hypothetical protein